MATDNAPPLTLDTIEPGRFYRISQVCEILPLHDTTLRRLMADGEVPIYVFSDGPTAPRHMKGLDIIQLAERARERGAASRGTASSHDQTAGASDVIEASAQRGAAA